MLQTWYVYWLRKKFTADEVSGLQELYAILSVYKGLDSHVWVEDHLSVATSLVGSFFKKDSDIVDEMQKFVLSLVQNESMDYFI